MSQPGIEINGNLKKDHPIEAILFDIGGTLRRTTKRSDDEKIRQVSQILEILGSDASPVEFARLLSSRVRAYKSWAEKTLIELSEQEFWVHWMLPEWPEELVRMSALQLNQIWRDAFGKREVLPETVDVIVELFRRGYRLGLVSNTTSSNEVPQTLEKLQLSGFFETIVLSCLYGKRKPDPSILLAAVANMDVRPDRCAYVGNCPEFDVAASQHAGFAKSVILQDPDKPPQQARKAALIPDHKIYNLMELYDIFPGLDTYQTLRQPSGNGRGVAETPPTWDASISTMWGIRNFPNIEDFFIAAKRLGFSKIELNHQVSSKMLSGIKMDRYSFSSVHEPCPANIPVEILKARDWLISAVDEDCRRYGVDSIKRSIDLAVELGVGVVVIHAGNVRGNLALEQKVSAMFESGLSQSQEYLEVTSRLVDERNLLVAPRLGAAMRSLKELIEYAGRSGIRLGLENRYHYLDIPGLDEMGILLDLAGPAQLGFVFDVGHAHTLDRLGFYPFEDWLRRYAPRIISVHLHDVIGIRDHLAPGLGEVDFNRVAAYLPKDVLCTVELEGRNTPAQVKAGIKILADKGCVKHC